MMCPLTAEAALRVEQSAVQELGRRVEKTQYGGELRGHVRLEIVVEDNMERALEVQPGNVETAPGFGRFPHEPRPCG